MRSATETYAPTWIGQGYGYKMKVRSREVWDQIPDGTVVYIPESGYDDGGDAPDPDSMYQKRDFVELAKDMAYELFQYVDWQCPEAALPELLEE